MDIDKIGILIMAANLNCRIGKEDDRFKAVEGYGTKIMQIWQKYIWMTKRFFIPKSLEFVLVPYLVQRELLSLDNSCS